MRRPRGLNTRLIAAIGVLAALHVTVFVVLLVTLHGLSAADDEARLAARVAMAANDSRVALALGDQAALRGSSSALDTAAHDAGLPGVVAVAAELGRIAVAPRIDPLHAQATDERLVRIVSRQRAARVLERDHARDLTRLAWVAGATGVVATMLCAIAFLVYLRRALLAPLRSVVRAAQELAGGDLRARVGETQQTFGEVGELARTFDQMAASLEDSRVALERQNAELARQRTELIEAVRSAREGASIVRAVIDATPDAIALLDGHGAVIVDNPPMRSVRAAFGARATALDTQGRLTPFDDHAIDADTERRDEITLLGTRRIFARYAAPVHDGRGRQIGRLLVLREITAEREAERAKEDFFALVSHELRTPLTAILGYVELVLGDDADAVPEEQSNHLEAIERNARRLVRLVGDLLFAAQVEGSPLLLEPGSVDLAQLVHDAVELARPRAENASIVLEQQLAPLEPCVGDRDRLAQVLDNLISNALKFTPAGGHVLVELTADGPNARIAVTDTGLGIPADDLPHLFERFYRARNAAARAVPGLGLGLMIARAIVTGHGGTIAVRSEVSRGTTFTVTLPLTAPTPAADQPGDGRAGRWQSAPPQSAGGR